MSKKDFLLPKGTFIQINGKKTHPRRPPSTHLLIYELAKDVLVTNGKGAPSRNWVIKDTNFWNFEYVSTCFVEEYDIILPTSNREAAPFYLIHE